MFIKIFFNVLIFVGTLKLLDMYMHVGMKYVVFKCLQYILVYILQQYAFIGDLNIKFQIVFIYMLELFQAVCEPS